MASKTKYRQTKQESEIEKCRNDSEWSKVLEFCKSVKSSNLGMNAMVYTGIDWTAFNKAHIQPISKFTCRVSVVQH